MRATVPNRLPHRWTPTILLASSILFTGCPRVLYLDYQPSLSINKGTGPVLVGVFAYAGIRRG